MSISRLLRPRSVAIVGASSTPGSLGGGVLANLDRFRFAGDLHLVNPRYDRIGERPCVHSIAELPDGIDCAVLAIPNQHVLDSVRACASKGIGGLIVLAGGFAEMGEQGKRAQEQLAAIARDSGLALQGPNCLGMINYVDGVPLMFGTAPFDALNDRTGVAVVSQSGAMASAVRVALQARGIGVSYSVSTGNEASLCAEDFLEELIADPHTRVIAMLMEQIRQPARFLDLASVARKAGKFIVLHHLGRSVAAREAARTHTGALSGDYAIMAANPLDPASRRVAWQGTGAVGPADISADNRGSSSPTVSQKSSAIPLKAPDSATIAVPPGERGLFNRISNSGTSINSSRLSTRQTPRATTCAAMMA